DPSVAVDLSQLAVSIRNDRELAEMGSTEPSNGLPSDGNQSDLEKVKGMVDSIRRLASVDLADTEFFMDEIEMASETFDADAGAHFQALAWALEAMVSAGNAYQRDNTLTTHTDDSTGIAVGISADETEVTYSVEDVTVTIGDGEEAVDITLDLSAIDGSYETAMSDTDSAETTSGSSTDADTVSGEIALSLSGSSASSAVLLSISEGELSGAGAAEYSNTESDSQMDTEAAASIDANLSELMLKAVVSLQEQQGDNPITFEGALQLDIDGLAVDASETESYISSNSVATFMDQWSVGFDELAFSASGSFSSAAGQSIVASFSLDATPDGMVYSCHSEDSVALQAKTCTSETESEYLALSFGVIVQLNVDSLADELTISVSGTRQGLQDADLRVNIRNAATMLEFNYDTADLDNDMQSLSITNEAGAVLSVTRAMMEGEYRITGNIVLDEVEYATIEEVRNFTAVRYNDGFNETF
ncbi:MAG: hypothetical protein KTR17_12530, partial [Cellvibrionaceae bacterium]|nr:hypothetical protein [Cellvibrionaceae bacterium]